MKRIKIGIALITMFGLLLGTASVVSAKTLFSAHHAKVSHTSTNRTSSKAKPVHKTVKSLTNHK